MPCVIKEVTAIEKAKTKSTDTKDSEKSDKPKRKVKFSLRNKFYLILIPLVSLIIITMSVYFIRQETSLLINDTINLAEREIEHLSNTAKLALLPDADILSMIDALGNLSKIPSIKYAYIYGSDNKVVQHYQIGKGIAEPEEGKNDKEISAKAIANTATEKPLLIKYTDPDEEAGLIYDFSVPVMHPLYKEKRTGTVRIGFSDKEIREANRQITKTIMYIAVAFIIIAIIGSFILARMTIGPVRKLSHGASMIGSGDLDYKIDIKRSDELGQLAFEFNQMTDDLKKAKEREVEARVMEEQLELAKEIQEGLNPMSFYEKNGVQIKGFTRAAKGVGGDYFDYIDIDENKVGALISDVSGKGVPASLVMVMIRTVFMSHITRKDIQCAGVVRAINDSLSADFAIDKFATLFFMIFNRATGEIAFSNAGHGPLFVYRASMGKCTVSKLDGMPIGIMEDIEYKQAKVKLFKGDIVLLNTDGITEMRNSEKEEFGMPRVQNMLIANSKLNAEEIVEKIVTEVDNFRGDEPPHDDMTVLVLKID